MLVDHGVLLQLIEVFFCLPSFYPVVPGFFTTPREAGETLRRSPPVLIPRAGGFFSPSHRGRFSDAVPWALRASTLASSRWSGLPASEVVFLSRSSRSSEGRPREEIFRVLVRRPPSALSLDSCLTPGGQKRMTFA